ncbi:MAG: type II secretion system protein GspL [Steroidobacteraceae bacterium]|nr:type II secretion system protein GspL [Steroidobacteraceae bacterium]
MSETLVIRLRAAEGAPASWLIVDGNAARSGPVQSGPVADALGAAQGRRVIVLLPGSEITLAEPELPFRGGARIAQAVPFALEEQLATDVEALHFAVGSRPVGAAGTPVAVVSRAALERWLAECDAAGLEVSSAYADSAAVPVAGAGCTLLLDESQLYVHRSNSLPYVIDAEPLAGALELVLPTPSDGGESGEHVTFYSGTAEYERHRELIEGLRARTATLQVKLLPDGPLPLLAVQAVGGAGVNLLQGAFAPRTSLQTRMREWRLPAALAAAVVLVFVGSQAASWWQQSRAEKALDAQIAEVFAQALPGQPVVDPRAQMQGALGSGGASGGLLPAMSVVAQAMAQAPAARVRSVSFRNNVIELNLKAPTIESLDGIKQGMNRNGITAEIQSANPSGDAVDGRLTLRLGPA